jgi:DNA sulfur modification protein DndE
MSSNIKTSLQNKSIITDLTHKLQLGTENIIARIAFAYSIADSHLDITQVQDSKGKEYSIKVLFGSQYEAIYIAMICQKYKISRLNKDITRYIKLHVDDGLAKLYTEYKNSSAMSSVDFLIPKIEGGLKILT